MQMFTKFCVSFNVRKVKRNVILDDIVVIGSCLKTTCLYSNIQMHFKNMKEMEDNMEAPVILYKNNIHTYIKNIYRYI